MAKRSKLVLTSDTVKVKKPVKSKKSLHPRNLHRTPYDFDKLCKVSPELTEYVYQAPRGQTSIDFSNSVAVKLLNQALLKLHYNVEFWDIPEGFLCPPIPGRADYLHYIADLLAAESHQRKVPIGAKVCGLDIGTGANCIYPILGSQSYGWHFVASDINPLSIATAEEICKANRALKGKVKCRLQKDEKHIFKGLIKPDDRFYFTLCNPPFHASIEDAQKGNQRKNRNLNRSSGKNIDKHPTLNFGGQGAELWCKGGEIAFVQQMIKESKRFSNNCLWFTTLVSKKENLPAVYQALKQVGAIDVKTVDMAQGQKISRFVAWSFQEVNTRHGWGRDKA
ncbi:MAG: 23S rRNA (adenine(1618)-N(6))-methyltransferase RlmF [Oceanospirillaceae bacterium]|nr:23S rRNA (adenine(1618)-N(6))-methyltransferase RlmF [Oceanospirillaceae bacterium]